MGEIIMNIHKKNAQVVFNKICSFLNYKSPSEIIIDNYPDKNYCKDSSCSYVREDPTFKQPCTCNDRSLIRLVNIDIDSNNTNFYRLYYQLGHEIGHQYFDTLKFNKDLSETLACYMSIIIVNKFIEDSENYLKGCIAVSANYKEYMEKSYKGAKELNYSIDKEAVINYFKDLIK